MANVTEVLDELQAALQAAKAAHAALDKAKATLEPLESAAKQADNAANVLMRQYAGLSNQDSPSWVGGRRGGVRGARKAYNISPESKIAATGKRAYTKAIKGGATDKEAKKASAAAEKLLSEKLGVK